MKMKIQLFAIVAVLLVALSGCKKTEPVQLPEEQEVTPPPPQEEPEKVPIGNWEKPYDNKPRGNRGEPQPGDDRVISIPDPAFEEFLAAFDSDKTINGQILYGDIRGIDSLFISAGRVSQFSSLIFSRLTAIDLTGIEHFTNLRWLIVDTAKMPELDLSQNTNLEYLDCSGFVNGETYYRSLRKLKLPASDKLKTLVCDFTFLEELSLEGLPNLESLSFSISEKLQNVKVDKNPNLTRLSGERQAPPMDLTHNRKLQYLTGMVWITQQTLKDKPELLYVDAGTDAGELYFCENPKLTYLRVGGSKLAKVIVPAGTSKDKISVQSLLDVTVSRCQ